MKCKIIELLDKNIREKLHDIAVDNNFMVIIPKAQAIKAKINK